VSSAPHAALPRQALLLAAGHGTRIREVTGLRPKPLLEVCGKTLLARHLTWLAATGVGEVWINLHYGGQLIVDTVGDGSGFGLNVNYVWEPRLLGTAGTFKSLAPRFGVESVLVVYADNLVSLDLAALAAQHHRRGAQVTLAVFDQNDVPNSGIAGGRIRLGTDGWVEAFVEGPDASPLVNAGVYLVEPSVASLIPELEQPDFGRDLFPSLLRSGTRIAAYQLDGYCFGVDTPAALSRALALLPALDRGDEVPVA
jgi:NDP-sugar pyrophosphorylase family protein